MRYHINYKGNPGVCTAQTGGCPFGDAEDDHYSSPEDARVAFEAEWESENVPRIRTKKAEELGKLTRQQAIELDQFFTKDELSESALATLSQKLGSLGYDPDKVHFVEPSAGGGSFVRAAEAVFPGRPVAKGDLAPKSEDIYRLDFINEDYSPLVQGDDQQRITIGNPPFGYKAELAKQFINRAFEFSDTVVMVLPIQFQKWGTQKDIDPDAKLIHDETLPYDAFTVNGTDYGVQCCFQIWTKRDTSDPDLRKRTKSPTTHDDFTTWYVSSKPESKRHMKEADWDFAVVSQGFKGNFEVIPRERAHELSPKRHYMLMKAHSPEAAEKLKSMDYEELASKNTTKVKGFGKADLVEAYSRDNG